MQNLKTRKKVTPQNQVQSSKFIQVSSNDISNVSKSQLLTENPQFSLLSRMKMKFIVNEFIRKLKNLTPPSVAPQGTTEQWENEQVAQQAKFHEQNQVQNSLFELSMVYPIIGILQVLEGSFIVSICWITSVSLVYNVKVFEYFFICVFAIYVLKIIGKTAFISKIQGPEKVPSHIKTEVLAIIQSILMIIYHVTDLQAGNITIYLLSLIFLFLIWRNVSSYFQFTVLFAEQNQLRKELRILQLFIFIINIAHIFVILPITKGLIMYGMAQIELEDMNWIKQAGLTDQSWHKKYFYSLYWAVTTMVTVGYGDLAPQNQIQVIVVTFIQLIGTALFGYMINVIGITVDEIQKKNQEFQNLISTVDKLKSYYQLSRELCNKMKSDIKKKESLQKLIPLKSKQELQFLDYIQPNLKEKFVLETNIKVIKKSIFFLTHFTTNFQNEIALKLNRIIYKAQQEVKIFNGEDISLAIIDSGKLCIQAEKHFNLSELRKTVKCLESIQGKPNLNVFGYSSLILNKKLHLRGFVKETAVVYLLKRTQVLDCMNRNMLDFESFSQLRQKMILYKLPEQIEAPSLRQYEKHFVPNIFILQKRVVFFSQPRERRKRKTPRLKVKIATIADYRFKTILMIDSQQNLYRKGISGNSINSFSEISETQEQKNELLNIKNDKIMLDQQKNFDNFMKKSNLEQVSKKYEKAYSKNTKMTTTEKRMSLRLKKGVTI